MQTHTRVVTHTGLEITQNERKAKIRAWFITAGLTQKAVAEALGISQQRFGRVLRGIYPQPSQVEYLRKLGMPEELLPQINEKSR